MSINMNNKYNDNIPEKITIEEFIEEVWQVEHLKINLKNVPDGALINHYPYKEPMNGEFTVDEFLEARIRPLLKSVIIAPFIVSDPFGS